MVEVKASNVSAHQRIDGMKNWVIAGMTSLVLQLLIILAAVYVNATKAGG